MGEMRCFFKSLKNFTAILNRYNDCIREGEYNNNNLLININNNIIQLCSAQIIVKTVPMFYLQQISWCSIYAACKLGRLVDLWAYKCVGHEHRSNVVRADSTGDKLSDLRICFGPPSGHGCFPSLPPLYPMHTRFSIFFPIYTDKLSRVDFYFPQVSFLFTTTNFHRHRKFNI
jgi:hypothetical protein